MLRVLQMAHLRKTLSCLPLQKGDGPPAVNAVFPFGKGDFHFMDSNKARMTLRLQNRVSKRGVAPLPNSSPFPQGRGSGG